MVAAPGTEPRALLDRYELREQVGLGGMGEVWLGWDRRLRREVAVKLLLPQLSDEPSFRQRFEVEARAAAALEHPNVVNVFDIDEDDGALFIVMERLPGPSLDRRLAEGPMAEEEVRRVAVDLLSGLAAAHAQNLVHRDIKPGNLIRSAGGRWKVGDFGVAKDLASTAALTLVGVAVGTPAYLAPEQLDGRTATAATDLWAAAVVLREALTGMRPFPGNDPIAVAHAIQHVPVPPLAAVRPDLDPALAAAIDRALSLDPRERFATALDMLAAVEGRAPAVVPAPSPVAPPAPVGAPPPPVGAPGPVPAAAVAPVAEPAPPGPVPPAGPVRGPDPDPGRSGARTVGIVAAVAGALVVLVLLVVLAAVALAGGDGDGDEAPVRPATSTAPPTSAPAAGEAPPPPAGPDGSEPGATRPDEMFPGGGTTTPTPSTKPDRPGGEQDDLSPGLGDDEGVVPGLGDDEEEGAGLGDEAGRDVLRHPALR